MGNSNNQQFMIIKTHVSFWEWVGHQGETIWIKNEGKWRIIMILKIEDIDALGSELNWPMYETSVCATNTDYFVWKKYNVVCKIEKIYIWLINDIIHEDIVKTLKIFISRSSHSSSIVFYNICKVHVDWMLWNRRSHLIGEEKSWQGIGYTSKGLIYDQERQLWPGKGEGIGKGNRYKKVYNYPI